MYEGSWRQAGNDLISFEGRSYRTKSGWKWLFLSRPSSCILLQVDGHQGNDAFPFSSRRCCLLQMCGQLFEQDAAAWTESAFFKLTTCHCYDSSLSLPLQASHLGKGQQLDRGTNGMLEREGKPQSLGCSVFLGQGKV